MEYPSPCRLGFCRCQLLDRMHQPRLLDRLERYQFAWRSCHSNILLYHHQLSGLETTSGTAFTTAKMVAR